MHDVIPEVLQRNRRKIPGNHEFDYGMQRFLHHAQKPKKDRFNGISGERRVKNVMAGGETLDPEATYTVAGQDYHLLHSGDGFAMFEGAKGVILTGKLDSEVLIDYIKDSLGGEVGSDYADPYGQGRIKIIQ